MPSFRTTKGIERRVELVGDLERDRHTASRQREHHHGVSAAILAQHRRELRAGLAAVGERPN
jgi:hypothetical protein